MSYNVVINSTNVNGNSNTNFLYRFIGGSLELYEGTEICVSQITIPYSWFSVNSTLYNNASFQYTFPYGVSSTRTYTVSISDGYYTVANLQSYLEQYFISQNQYYTNSTTQVNQYYISLLKNITYYTNQIICYPVPTSLPSGYISPTAGFNYNNGTAYGNPTTTRVPQVVIQNNSFGSLIGYKAGIYPLTFQTSNYNVLGTTVPNITPVNSLIVRCSLATNECASPTDILDTFPINASFGSNIQYIPPYQKWVKVKSGIFNQFSLYIQDQNFNTIQANDPNVLISILIKNGEKKEKKEDNPRALSSIDIKSIPK